MNVEVTIEQDGSFVAAVLQLPRGRVLVSTNADPGPVQAYRSMKDWQKAAHPYDVDEEYDSMADALAAEL
jgi:hypothetical protein